MRNSWYNKLIQSAVEQKDLLEKDLQQEEQPQQPIKQDNIMQKIQPQENMTFDDFEQQEIPTVTEDNIYQYLADNNENDKIVEEPEQKQQEPAPLEMTEEEIPEFGSNQEALNWAIQNGKVVRINYTTKKGIDVSRIVEPHAIVSAKTGNQIVVTYDRSVRKIRAYIVNNIMNYIFTGKKFKQRMRVLPNKGKIAMDNNIFSQLNEIGNELEAKGLEKSAAIVTDAMDTLLQIKTAQYVGSQGYWIRNERCWSNCYRSKRTTSPGKTAHAVWTECWEEYNKAIDTDDTKTWDKYASMPVNVKTARTNRLEDEDDIYEMIANQEEGRDYDDFNPENADIDTNNNIDNENTLDNMMDESGNYPPEFVAKLQRYKDLEVTGQQNSPEGMQLFTEFQNLGLVSSPEIREYSSSKEIKTASKNFIKTVQSSIKDGASLPETVYAKINEEIEKTNTQIIENADILISLAEVLSEKGHKELGQKLAKVSVEMLKEADFGRGKTKGDTWQDKLNGDNGNFQHNVKNLFQRGWDKLRGRSIGGRNENQMVIQRLQRIISRIGEIMQKIQFGNRWASTDNVIKEAAPLPINPNEPFPKNPQQPVQPINPFSSQPIAKNPRYPRKKYVTNPNQSLLRQEVSRDFGKFMNDLQQEFALLAGIAAKGKNKMLPQIVRTINNALVNSQNIFKKNKGFTPKDTMDILTKLRTSLITALPGMQQEERGLLQQEFPTTTVGNEAAVSVTPSAAGQTGTININDLSKYSLQDLQIVSKAIQNRINQLNTGQI
jgi:hypothetical protein